MVLLTAVSVLIKVPMSYQSSSLHPSNADGGLGISFGAFGSSKSIRLPMIFIDIFLFSSSRCVELHTACLLYSIFLGYQPKDVCWFQLLGDTRIRTFHCDIICIWYTLMCLCLNMCYFKHRLNLLNIAGAHTRTDCPPTESLPSFISKGRYLAVPVSSHLGSRLLTKFGCKF